jgi:hypothetical protein
MVSGAIDLESRDRRRCSPLMLRNQGLGECLAMMCTSCGKKGIDGAYSAKSIIQLNLPGKDCKKSI